MKIVVSILLIVLWVASAAGTVLLMSFANNVHSSKLVSGIACHIDYKGKTPLFSENDVIKQVNAGFGKLTSKSIGKVEVEAIGRLLNKNPYLQHINVNTNVDGQVEIHASQCTPVVRFISSAGRHQYISDDGRIMPTSLAYPYKALVATGNIDNPLPAGENILNVPSEKKQPADELTALRNIHYLATIVTADTVLDALVEQIYVTPGNKLQLVTKAGSHIVNLGDTTDMRLKLDNLKCFYKEGLVKTGWNRYSEINLEYRNQIVCTK